jgi:hypothetical protein
LKVYAILLLLLNLNLSASSQNAKNDTSVVYKKIGETTIKSVETIADTVFVFYILNTLTGTFTNKNNLLMLKLSTVSGNILDNLQLDNPYF